MKKDTHTKLKSLIRNILSEMKQSTPVRHKTPTVKKTIKESLKSSIIRMIKEELEDVNITEMARTPMEISADGVVSGLGSKFIVPDEASPTGFIAKGHRAIKDGTPARPPKGPYVKKTDNPNMGRSTSTDTEQPSTVDVSIDGKKLDVNFYDVPGRDIERTLFDEAFILLGDKLGLHGKISASAIAAIKSAQETGGNVDLTFDRTSKEIRKK